ncbi:MAG: cation-translocating P-type ATPase [Chlamydiales bacterium]|nr:cation-translocating P-type ATPase [Chlamydiales bacterium]
MSHLHFHKKPFASFDDFFSSGMEESISPFLTSSSRKWAFNHSLYASILSAIFLVFSYGFSFFHPNVSLLFLSFVYFLSGTPALIASIEDLKTFNINIDVLMTLAAFLSILIGSEREGALLLVLFALSHAMEHMVTRKTKGALQSLHHIAPTMAIIVNEDGSIYQKSVKEITKGAHLLIQSGEIIPLDGFVIDGNSSVNLVHLTGESIPTPKHKGSDVQAGSLNLEGVLTIEVSKVAADSTLTKIIQLITQAQEAKPQIQKILDRFSQLYATSIIGLAVCFAALLPFFLHIPYSGIEGSIYRSLAFLIAASPCALIIATPTAYLSAISSVTKKGILLKGGVILDALSKCTTFAFDKTGTLTTGNLSCSIIEEYLAHEHFDDATALQIAYSLERSSSHPIAKAITNLAQSKKLKPLPTSDIQTIPGFGIQGTVHFREKQYLAFIGNIDFILQKKPSLSSELKRNHKEGHLITYLLIENAIYLFHFQDEVRLNMKQTLDQIKDLGLKTIMLTGDHEENASFVAKTIGIDEYYADIKPEEKLDIISKLAKTENLVMIGDGINDAPALARANVGISMGQIGSATAIEASDIVFLKDDISLLPWLYKKSKKTLVIVKQNLTLALGVILLATTPALLGVIPLWLAVILHEGGTVVVGLNSLRLLKR